MEHAKSVRYIPAYERAQRIGSVNHDDRGAMGFDKGETGPGILANERGGLTRTLEHSGVSEPRSTPLRDVTSECSAHDIQNYLTGWRTVTATNSTPWIGRYKMVQLTFLSSHWFVLLKPEVTV